MTAARVPPAGATGAGEGAGPVEASGSNGSSPMFFPNSLAVFPPRSGGAKPGGNKDLWNKPMLPGRTKQGHTNALRPLARRARKVAGCAFSRVRQAWSWMAPAGDRAGGFAGAGARRRLGKRVSAGKTNALASAIAEAKASIDGLPDVRNYSWASTVGSRRSMKPFMKSAKSAASSSWPSRPQAAAPSAPGMFSDNRAGTLKR